MRICPSCGRENPDSRDFCECGEYLRWEPTRQTPVIEPPAETPQPLGPGDGESATPKPPAPPETEPPGTHPGAPPAPTAAADPPAGDAEPPPPRPGRPIADTAVREPPAPAQPAAPVLAPDAVTLTLRVAGDDGASGTQVTAQTAAGGQVTVLALIRNQSGIVDNYDLNVTGLPEGWWTVAPPTVYLVPFGSRGTYEQEVEVHLHPPRSPEAEAREWSFDVIASSRAAETRAASARATLAIDPYQEIELELQPERAAGRRRARFTVAVRNRANARGEVELSAVDSEQLCRFEFDRPPEAVSDGAESAARSALDFSERVERDAHRAAGIGRKGEALARGQLDVGGQAEALADSGSRSGRELGGLLEGTSRGQAGPGHGGVAVDPGQREEMQLTVFAPKPILIGRPVDRRLQVSAEPTGSEIPPLVRDATFRQRPWLPWWSPLALLAAIALAFLIWSLLPQTTTVPKVTGERSVFSVGRALKEQDLKLGRVTAEPRKGAKPGAIVEQDPKAGEEADEGSAVDLVTALGSKERKVPRVVGLTLPDAESKLTESTFQLKAVRPEPDDPAKATVLRQVPKPGAKAREGSAVSLFVEVREEAGAGPGPTGGAGNKDGPVPGSPAAGPRKIVFDNGEGRLSIVDATGDKKKALRNPAPKKFNFASQPVWDPTGSRIVYRSGKDEESQAGIWLMDLTKEKPTARPLTNPAFDKDVDDRRPAISPDGQVVAFVRGSKKDSDHDLCFVRTTDPASPSCIDEPDQEVTRPTWAPDGKAILVVASDAKDRQFELLRYTSPNPSSDEASDWQARGFETDGMHSTEEGRLILAVAWSPARDRDRVAFSANWTSPADFGLFLSEVSKDDNGGDPTPLEGVSNACELSWSPDGKQLAVAGTAGCTSEGVASIYVVGVDDPRPELRPVTTGRNPSWQPGQPAP